MAETKAMTPAAESIRHNLETRYQLLDRDKLTRWQMARAANIDLRIADCRGKEIGVGLGTAFEGSTRQVFWNFMKPCLDDSIQETCNELETAIAGYSEAQRRMTIDTVELQLRGFVSRIYERMVQLDRLMRGNGFPDRIEPRDPTAEIQSFHELIAHKFAILRDHHTKHEPVKLGGRAKAFWSNHWQWLIGISVAVAGILLSLMAG